jgi:preprotein translocase subunit SecD
VTSDDISRPTLVPRWMVAVVIFLLSVGGGTWIRYLHSEVETVDRRVERTDSKHEVLRERVNGHEVKLGVIQKDLDSIQRNSVDTNDRMRNVEQLLMESRRR